MTLPDSTNDPSGSTEMDWNLIARYLANELSAEERQMFERGIADDASQQKQLAQLGVLWNQAGSLPSVPRLQAMWRTIARRINNDQTDLRTGSIEPLVAGAAGTVVPETKEIFVVPVLPSVTTK